MRNAFIACAGVLLCSLIASEAYAATTLDVDNLVVPPSPSASGFFSGQPDPAFTPTILYQTFTATQTGTLALIDIIASGSGSGNVYLSVYGGGNQTTPGTTLLGTISRAASNIPFVALSSFDFSTLGISIVAGQTYTFSQSADLCGTTGCTTFSNWNYFNPTTTSNGYAGGALSIAAPALSGFPSSDLNFRTYVNVADGVPEPAIWAMMLLGFGAVGATLRRRRSVRPSLVFRRVAS